MQIQKISMLPPQKGLEFLGGGGFCKAKKFKEMYEVEFPEGWEGVLEKIPFMEEVWMFSGITNCLGLGEREGKVYASHRVLEG